jgi:hypothetical protein
MSDTIIRTRLGFDSEEVRDTFGATYLRSAQCECLSCRARMAMARNTLRAMTQSRRDEATAEMAATVEAELAAREMDAQNREERCENREADLREETARFHRLQTKAWTIVWGVLAVAFAVFGLGIWLIYARWGGF